jgi:hypothetical protein
MIDQYVANLRKLRGIAFDVGDRDRPENARLIDQVLARYAVPHQFEIYDGDHLNHIGDRLGIKLVLFFAQTLSYQARKFSK